jgi:hypothetical protein
MARVTPRRPTPRRSVVSVSDDPDMDAAVQRLLDQRVDQGLSRLIEDQAAIEKLGRILTNAHRARASSATQ